MHRRSKGSPKKNHFFHPLTPLFVTSFVTLFAVMVLLSRRRSSTASENNAANNFSPQIDVTSSQTSLAYGDGRRSPLQWTKRGVNWCDDAVPTSPTAAYLRRDNSFGFQPKGSSEATSTWMAAGWLVKAVYATALLSWIGAIQVAGRNTNIMLDLQETKHSYELQTAHTKETYKEKLDALIQQKTLVRQLTKTTEVLKREVRMTKELVGSDGKIGNAPPRAGSGDVLVSSWLLNRQETLGKKIEDMQAKTQAWSQMAIMQRFGKGPHRVKFTIGFIDKNGVEEPRNFVVELGSIDTMPHSIHFFLDMVAAKVWDNTVFLHHEQVEHVVQVAPIDFDTQKEVQNGFRLHRGLGFPEYSDEYQHTKYTIGFAGQGPAFYINTMDNSRAHGPGGQPNHIMSNDGDPCFGRVVDGVEVIDDLIKYGMQQNQMEEGHHPWADDKHTWTHLISVEMVLDEKEAKTSRNRRKQKGIN